MKIFDYYLDRADKRRNSAVSAEKMQQKDLRNLTPKDLSSSFSVNKTQTLQQLKEQVRAQKSLIGYREYIQVFCGIWLNFDRCTFNFSIWALSSATIST